MSKKNKLKDMLPEGLGLGIVTQQAFGGPVTRSKSKGAVNEEDYSLTASGEKISINYISDQEAQIKVGGKVVAQYQLAPGEDVAGKVKKADTKALVNALLALMYEYV